MSKNELDETIGMYSLVAIMIGAALVIFRFMYLALRVLFESEKFIFVVGFTLLFGGMTGVGIALLVARYGKRTTDD
jgi:hypothetical protein